MIVPVGSLRHEIPAGVQGDRVLFDREGCAVGRGVFSPEVIRALRAPLLEALVVDGLVEPVDGRPDRLLWVGETEGFDPRGYQPKVEQGVDELLLKPGLAATAIEAVWGTPAATSAWHARCACYARGIVGQTWTEQPNDRVERAFTTLQARGLIEPYDGHSEKSWWDRFYQATPRGRSDVTRWLDTPEERDPRLRSVKLLLGDWLGLEPIDP
jgi:hypothetical protein